MTFTKIYYLVSWCCLDGSLRKTQNSICSHQVSKTNRIVRFHGKFQLRQVGQERRPKLALQPKTWLLQVGSRPCCLNVAHLLVAAGRRQQQRVSVTTSTTRRGASQLSESCKGEWAREVKWMWFLSLRFCFEFMYFVEVIPSFHWWFGASSKILGRYDWHTTPPRSILQNPVKTAVLPVSPTTATLMITEHICVLSKSVLQW